MKRPPPTHTSMMEQDDALLTAMLAAVEQYNLNCGIETGTHLGTGSTQLMIKALRGPMPIWTMEVNRELHAKAKENLRAYPNVIPMLGLSVGLIEAMNFVRDDVAIRNHTRWPDILIDSVDNPVKFYTDELRGVLYGKGIAAEGLERLLYDLLPDKIGTGGRPLILLDSAGGIGWLEYSVVARRMKYREYVLVLDDCDHLKHFRSKEDIKAHPELWTVLAEDPKGRWIVAYHAPQQQHA